MFGVWNNRTGRLTISYIETDDEQKHFDVKLIYTNINVHIIQRYYGSSIQNDYT